MGQLITWEIAYKLIFIRGLIPYGKNATYEDEELKEICERLNEIDDERKKLETEIKMKIQWSQSPTS